MPYPENLDSHFDVDPAKWDFYGMDCYRLLGASGGADSAENRLAQAYAREVIRLGTDYDGTQRSHAAAAVDYLASRASSGTRWPQGRPAGERPPLKISEKETPAGAALPDAGAWRPVLPATAWRPGIRPAASRGFLRPPLVLGNR